MPTSRLLAVSYLLLWPVPTWAQPAGRFLAGDTVRVVAPSAADGSWKPIQGVVTRISAAGIELGADAGSSIIPASKIVRVDVARGNKPTIWPNFLRGAAVGLYLGARSSRTQFGQHPRNNDLAGAALGAITGAAVGALIRVTRWETVPFRAEWPAPLPGMAVRFVSGGARTAGTVVQVGQDSVWVQQADGVVEALGGLRAATIELPIGARRRTWEGVLKGGAIGAALGALIGFGAGSLCDGQMFCYSSGEMVPALGGVFGVLGASIGALAARHSIMWQRGPGVRSLTVAPAISARGGGLVLRLKL